MLRILALLSFVTGSALAGNVLYTKTKIDQLPLCKAYSCKQISKVFSDDPIQNYVETKYRLEKVDAWITTDHLPNGLLMGAVLEFRRQPLTESDNSLALRLIKELTGGVYAQALIVKCFDRAESNAVADEYFSSETILATGSINSSLNWVSKCYAPINDFKYTSLLSVYGTFH